MWRRQQLAPLFAIAICAELGYAALNISAMPIFLLTELQVDGGMISLILTAFLLSEAVFKSPMGHWGDHGARRYLLIFAPMISVATALLSTVMHSVEGFVMLRVLDGIGAAMIWPNVFAAAGGAVTKDVRSEAISVLNMCYWVGIALGPFLDAMVFEITGIRIASFYLVAVLFAAAAYLAWRFVPKRDAAHVPEGVKVSVLWHAATEIPGHVFMTIVTFIGIGFPIGIIKLYAHTQLHVSDIQFGSMLLPAAALMAVLSMPIGRLVERFGRANSVKLGLAVGALGMWRVAFTTDKLMLAMAACTVGLAFVIAIPAWLAVVSDINESRRGLFLGVIQTAQGIGALLGAPIGGFLYQQVAPNAPFVGTAIALSSAFFIAGWLFKIRPPKPGNPETLEAIERESPYLITEGALGPSPIFAVGTGSVGDSEVAEAGSPPPEPEPTVEGEESARP